MRDADFVRPSDPLWKQGGGYYTDEAAQLRQRPVLPDVSRLRDRRLMHVFEGHGRVAAGSRVLEIGCGRSPWLPLLARRTRATVFGIDIDPFAAELARANLEGAGASGEILCRDAFDGEQNRDLVGQFDLVYSMGVLEHFSDAAARVAALARYVKPGGRLLTTVPNMQGLNWWLQRVGGLDRLEMHVVYDWAKLARAHEEAGLETVATGYVGFFDGHVTAAGQAGRIARDIHRWACRASSLCGEAWIRAPTSAATYASSHSPATGAPAAATTCSCSIWHDSREIIVRDPAGNVVAFSAEP